MRGVRPGQRYTVFSDEELDEIRETLGCARERADTCPSPAKTRERRMERESVEGSLRGDAAVTRERA